MIRLVLACAPGDEAEEIARAAVLEAFADGVEERRAAAGGLELAVYCADRPARLPEVAGTWSEEPVADGWEDGWRAFHTGRTVGGRLWVGPPWETPPAGVPAVVIDPGQAFGTGSHATTLLCLELLLEQPPGPALDLGCGSGVLALAAARLGHAPVLACDDDPVAVDGRRGERRPQRLRRSGLAVRRALRRAAEGGRPVAREPPARAAPGAGLAPRPAAAPDRVGPARRRGARGARVPDRRAADARRVGGAAVRARGRPVSFSVEFLGCKISQTDMQGVRERLLAGGLEEAREGGAVHVVNTCCVTHEAVAKSRKAVRAALRRGAGHVYVTGCATRLGAGTFARAGDRVHGRARDRRGGGRAHRPRARRHRPASARRRGSSAPARS